MRRFSKFWVVLLVAAFLGSPSAAQAQFRTFGGGYFGGGYFGGYFGRGGYTYAGGYGYLGGYGFGNLGGYGNFGYGPTGLPGVFPGMPYSNYTPGVPYQYGYGQYGYGYGPSATVLLPGFGASDPPRARPTLYPAIPEPARPIIAAALETEEKDKARIEIHVPAMNAKVYLDGVLTRQTGLDRAYVTPKLKPKSRYTFDVRIDWQDESGRNRTVRRTIAVHAGETTVLNLRDPD
jgi:uncharacterized protein (TIGR03000 family)